MPPVRIYVGRNVDAELRPDGMIWLKQKDGPVLVIDHGSGWKSVLVNAGSKLKRGTRIRQNEPLGIALGRVEIELQNRGKAVSPALIAGSSAMLSNQ